MRVRPRWAGRTGLHGAPAIAAALVLALTACGGSDADSDDMRVDDDAAMDTTPAGTPAPPSLPTLAEDARRDTRVTLTDSSVVAADDLLPAGEISFQVVNTGSATHTFALEGEGVAQRTEPIEAGATGSLTAVLSPGTYRLYCPDGEEGGSHALRRMSAPVVVR